MPAGVACILLYILRGWIGAAGPPARMIIAQACRSRGGTACFGAARRKTSVPSPCHLWRAKDNPSITICFLHHAVIWSSPMGWARAAAPHRRPRGLEGGDLLLGHRGNGYTDSSTLYSAARVSLTDRKDRGPYENETPAALCPFNTNDELPRFRGAGSFFWKATQCWQTKQMQGRDTKSFYCCARNRWVELFIERVKKKKKWWRWKM